MRNEGIKMNRRNFLSGLGRVVAGVGAVGLTGCGRSPIVDFIATKVVYDNVVKGEEVEGKELIQGPVVPYDVDFLAYYRIKDLKTGEVEIVEGEYGNLSKNWETGLKVQYRGKCPDGYMVEMIEGERLISTRESIQ